MAIHMKLSLNKTCCGIDVREDSVEYGEIDKVTCGHCKVSYELQRKEREESINALRSSQGYMSNAQRDMVSFMLRKHNLNINDVKKLTRNKSMLERLHKFHRDLYNQSTLLSYDFQADIFGVSQYVIYGRVNRA